jgi:hypothetical protein
VIDEKRGKLMKSVGNSTNFHDNRWETRKIRKKIKRSDEENR